MTDEGGRPRSIPNAICIHGNAITQTVTRLTAFR